MNEDDLYLVIGKLYVETLFLKQLLTQRESNGVPIESENVPEEKVEESNTFPG